MVDTDLLKTFVVEYYNLTIVSRDGDITRLNEVEEFRVESWINI